MRKNDDESKTVRLEEVAILYYKRNFNLKQIGKQFGISANHAGRLLRIAQKQGIVEILVHTLRSRQLKPQLLKTYECLRDVRIINSVTTDYSEQRRVLGKEAANYFDEILGVDKTMSIGLDGGPTVYHLVDALETRSRNIKIYPLVCKWRDVNIDYYDANVLVHLLYYKSKDAAAGFWIPLQPIKEGVKKDRLRAQIQRYVNDNPEIQKTYAAMQNVDVSFVNVGILKDNSPTTRHLKKIGVTYDYLHNQLHTIGIACGICFNQNVESVADYFLSVQLEQLQKLTKKPDKKVVLIAGGEHKLRAIRALLEHKIGNVLIIDEKTASKLIESTESEKLVKTAKKK